MKEELPFERIKREVLVRKQVKARSKFGCIPEQRPVKDLIDYGIVNINKPRGPTSHQVSAYVQKILGLTKSGHAGTLDPKVTGVLPVALGKATRVVQGLINCGKEYIAIMHLHKEIPEEEIKKACQEFVGKIKQLPPIKSAVKRQWRFRKIYYINILEINEKDVLLKIGCQAGTYIRKLIHDLGQKLECGAHMAELIRTKAGPFNDKEMISLQDLTDAFYYCNQGNEKYIRQVVKPMEFAVAHLAKIWVLDSTVDNICHGANLNVPGISKVESDIQKLDTVAIMTLKNELVALGEAHLISKEMLKQKGFAVKIKKVFMQPGTYPRIEKAKDNEVIL